jgi:membrane protein DedA with SNARE-associated domain
LTFFVATFIGAYIWCSLLIGAGYFLGHEWAIISQYLKRFFPYLAAIGTVAYIGYLLIRRYLQNRSALNLERP